MYRLVEVDLRQLEGPRDPDLPALHALMAEVFADPNLVFSRERLQEFLAEADAPDRKYHILVVRRGGQMVGGTIFAYLPEANCGFSEYIMLRPEARGVGLGRQLFEERRRILDADARRCGYDACRGLFIETENPDRTPAEFLAQELETSLDARVRLQMFGRMGFRRCDAPYIHLPLGPDQEPVDYLDLLFAPWDARVQAEGRIPSRWIEQSMVPMWQRWAPDRYHSAVTRFAREVGDRPVALLPVP